MTEITYQLSEADLVALAEHNHKRSKTFRKTRRRAVLGAIFFFSLAALVFWLQFKDPVLSITFCAAGMLFALVFPLRLKRNLRRTVNAAYGEGKNRALFVRQTMRVEDDALVLESVAMSNRIKWEYIERVDITDDYMFVYLSALSAHVVPADGIIRGDYDYFVHEVQKRWQAATAQHTDSFDSSRHPNLALDTSEAPA
jgi:hypothetical protein